VLYVGRIAAEKGVHLLIEAFARLAQGPLAEWRLRIVSPHKAGVGDGRILYVRRGLLLRR